VPADGHLRSPTGGKLLAARVLKQEQLAPRSSATAFNVGGCELKLAKIASLARFLLQANQ
jgi:hypothetical protein